MPCSWVSLDAMDISGEVQLEVGHDVYKERLDPLGKAIDAGAPSWQACVCIVSVLGLQPAAGAVDA